MKEIEEGNAMYPARRRPVIFDRESKPEELRYYAVAALIGMIAGLIGATFHLAVDWVIDTHS